MGQNILVHLFHITLTHGSYPTRLSHLSGGSSMTKSLALRMSARCSRNLLPNLVAVQPRCLGHVVLSPGKFILHTSRIDQHAHLALPHCTSWWFQLQAAPRHRFLWLKPIQEFMPPSLRIRAAGGVSGESARESVAGPGPASHQTGNHERITYFWKDHIQQKLAFQACSSTLSTGRSEMS